MPIRVIEGDLLEADTKHICHQCNAVSREAACLAKAIFGRFPYADIYSARDPRPYTPPPYGMPGNIIVRGNGEDQRFVINMIAQYYPGVSRYENALDGREARRRAFAECLVKIARIPDLGSLGFPWGIGCGLAGGNWDEYLETLTRFDERVEAEVRLYRLIERKVR